MPTPWHYLILPFYTVVYSYYFSAYISISTVYKYILYIIHVTDEYYISYILCILFWSSVNFFFFSLFLHGIVACRWQMLKITHDMIASDKEKNLFTMLMLLTPPAAAALFLVYSDYEILSTLVKFLDLETTHVMSTHHTSHRSMIRQKIDTLLLLNFLILFVSIKCKWIVSFENAEALLVFAIFFFLFCSIESFLFVWRFVISCVSLIYIYISYFENAKNLPCVRHFSFYSHFYILFCLVCLETCDFDVLLIHISMFVR